jgi:DNA-binding NtrC family response regulator
LVDDELVLLDLTANILRLDGHMVKALCDPLEAELCLQSGHLIVDLLLTDISLQPISGIELASRLRKAGFLTPVLFMSGYGSLTGAAADCLEEHAILEKPFTAWQLRAAVSKALLKRKTHSP